MILLFFLVVCLDLWSLCCFVSPCGSFTNFSDCALKTTTIPDLNLCNLSFEVFFLHTSGPLQILDIKRSTVQNFNISNWLKWSVRRHYSSLMPMSWDVWSGTLSCSACHHQQNHHSPPGLLTRCFISATLSTFINTSFHQQWTQSKWTFSFEVQTWAILMNPSVQPLSSQKHHDPSTLFFQWLAQNKWLKQVFSVNIYIYFWAVKSSCCCEIARMAT